MLDWLEEGAALHSAFEKVFGRNVRPFGSPALRRGGLSDTREGVQWSLAYDPDTSRQIVAVNLEGMQYSGWPIADLILNELESPELLRTKIDADDVSVRWRRDYWQVTARPVILERDIQPTPIALADLDEQTWRGALCEALGCLDPERRRRGRATQTVTLAVSGRSVTGPVSPHLQVLYVPPTSLPWNQCLADGMTRLRPIHEWAVRQSRSVT